MSDGRGFLCAVGYHAWDMPGMDGICTRCDASMRVRPWPPMPRPAPPSPKPFTLAVEETPPHTEALRRCVTDRLDFIAANREKYLAAWIAETGLRPSECVLVETTKTEGFVITTTVEVKRKESHEH